MDFDKLLDSLNKLSITKNTLLLREFEPFSKLYQKNNDLSDAEAKSLSERFLARIDPYENINIVDEKGGLLLTLPRINNTTKTIDNRFEGAKNMFRNQASDDVPRYRSNAVHGIIQSFRESAQDSKYLEGVEARVHDFNKVNKAFQATQIKVIESSKIESEVEDSLTPSVDSQFDWEIS